MAAPRQTGDAVHVLRMHSGPISFAAWSPNDAYILTCSADKTLRVWNVSSGVCLHTVTEHADTVLGCAWCPDSRRFASCSVDRKIILWDRSGTEERRWTDDIWTEIAITHDGTRLLAVRGSNEEQEKICVYAIDGNQRDTCVRA